MRVDRLEIEVDDGNRLVWDRSLDHDSPSEYVARVIRSGAASSCWTFAAKTSRTASCAGDGVRVS